MKILTWWSKTKRCSSAQHHCKLTQLHVWLHEADTVYARNFNSFNISLHNRGTVTFCFLKVMIWATSLHHRGNKCAGICGAIGVWSRYVQSTQNRQWPSWNHTWIQTPSYDVLACFTRAGEVTDLWGPWRLHTANKNGWVRINKFNKSDCEVKIGICHSGSILGQVCS